jgi:hypothetical protein
LKACNVAGLFLLFLKQDKGRIDLAAFLMLNGVQESIEFHHYEEQGDLGKMG